MEQEPVVSEIKKIQEQEKTKEAYVKVSMEPSSSDGCYVLQVGTESNPEASTIKLGGISDQDREKIFTIAKECAKQVDKIEEAYDAIINKGGKEEGKKEDLTLDEKGIISLYENMCDCGKARFVSSKTADYVMALRKIRSVEEFTIAPQGYHAEKFKALDTKW